MTAQLKLNLLKLLEHVRAMEGSEAKCYCGRHYRLTFDVNLRQLVDVVEAQIKAETTDTRFTLLEVD